MYIFRKLPAIDKNNYVGGPLNALGRIRSLDKFSLDENLLNGISLEERQIFCLSEKDIIVLIDKYLLEIIEKEKLTGFLFFRVDEWDSNAMFR